MIHSTLRLSLAGALLWTVLVLPETSHAQNVTVSPRTIRHSLGSARALTVTLRWRASGGLQIGSGGGQVQTDEASPNVLQALGPLADQFGPVATFTETVTLSGSSLQAAAQGGTRRLLIVRTFTIAGNPVTSAAIIDLVSPMGAPFAVSRIQLRLGEGAPLRLVSRGSEVIAWADVSYHGTGQLDAMWELSEPASSGGDPVYRPLRRLRRALGAGQRVSLRAPDLPTDQTGLHILRLRILNPGPAFTEPTLRYYVAPEGERPREPLGVILGEPYNRAELSVDTIFTWRRLAGARAYRLEFYPGRMALTQEHIRFDPDNPSYADVRGPEATERPYEAGVRPLEDPTRVPPSLMDDPPLAGMLLGGDSSSATLSAVARRHLVPGQSYVWVVRALGPGSVPIGLSPPRLIHVPE